MMRGILLRLSHRLAAKPGYHNGILASSFSVSSNNRSQGKLDELLPPVFDFPGRHIGPRKHEAREMLKEIGYSVSWFGEFNFTHLISIRAVVAYS